MSTEIVTEPTTVRHRVGTCPGCKSGVYAEVDIVTQVHSPRLLDGKPQDCAHAVVTGSRVYHHCGRTVDGEWTGTDTPPTCCRIALDCLDHHATEEAAP